jgi:hypothetical protein
VNDLCLFSRKGCVKRQKNQQIRREPESMIKKKLTEYAKSRKAAATNDRA